MDLENGFHKAEHSSSCYSIHLMVLQKIHLSCTYLPTPSTLTTNTNKYDDDDSGGDIDVGDDCDNDDDGYDEYDDVHVLTITDIQPAKQQVVEFCRSAKSLSSFHSFALLLTIFHSFHRTPDQADRAFLLLNPTAYSI